MNMAMMFMMMLSMVFIWIKHPLSMSVIILMQTIIASMMVGMMLGSFWFSYIIMIIMSSGMLVLFMYMASIASNEKFYPSIKMLLLTSTLLFILMMPNISEEYNSLLNNNYMSMMLNKLFNSMTMYITLMLVMYLLYTMITVSKIVNINNGPLRMMNK